MTDVVEMIDPVTGELIHQQPLKQAKEQGVDLVGPDRLLNGLTTTVLEVEMTEHLGHVKHGVCGGRQRTQGHSCEDGAYRGRPGAYRGRPGADRCASRS